jgi:hypothetical protein
VVLGKNILKSKILIMGGVNALQGGSLFNHNAHFYKNVFFLYAPIMSNKFYQIGN